MTRQSHGQNKYARPRGIPPNAPRSHPVRQAAHRAKMLAKRPRKAEKFKALHGTNAVPARRSKEA